MFKMWQACILDFLATVAVIVLLVYFAIIITVWLLSVMLIALSSRVLEMLGLSNGILDRLLRWHQHVQNARSSR
jgi:hypothetical protein